MNFIVKMDIISMNGIVDYPGGVDELHIIPLIRGYYSGYILIISLAIFTVASGFPSTRKPRQKRKLEKVCD
jgi:hypothetical protein